LANKKIISKTTEDKIFEEVYWKLSKDKNNNAIDYLFEIVILESDYFYLEKKYLERKKEYLELKIKYLKSDYKFINQEKEIVHYYCIFIQNLIYRYYSLLEKLAQLINSIWLQSFAEEKCSFKKVKKACEKDREFYFIGKELKKLNIEPVDKILEERKRLTHRRIVKGKGSSFSSLILPLGGEYAKEFFSWEEESNKILKSAYKNTFMVIKTLLKIFVNEN
jgi:hypothetical protein